MDSRLAVREIGTGNFSVCCVGVDSSGQKVSIKLGVVMNTCNWSTLGKAGELEAPGQLELSKKG